MKFGTLDLLVVLVLETSARSCFWTAVVAAWTLRGVTSVPGVDTSD